MKNTEDALSSGVAVAKLNTPDSRRLRSVAMTDEANR